MNRSRFRALLTWAVAAPVALLAILAVIFLLLVRWLNSEVEWVDHTDEVISAAERTRGLLVDMETGVRGYLLTGNGVFLEPYQRALPEAGGAFDRLQRLVADNPAQRVRVERLRAELGRWEAIAAAPLKPGMPLAMRGSTQMAAKNQMDVIRDEFGRVLAEEQGLRARRTASVRRVTRTVVGTTLGTALLLGLLVGFSARRALLSVATEYAAALVRAEALAAENERAYRDVESASRAKDEFLATLSHELRTPLTAILGWSRLLQRDVVDPALTRDAVDAIARSANAQAALVEDILDVSRIITGKLRLEMGDVRVGDAVRQAMASMQPAAGAKQIDIAGDVDESVEVWADPNRLQQVIWNLLSNAVKFSPPASRIDVRVRREGGDAVITVEDRGHGITPAFLPFVFDRFRQADAGTTREHGGLGIGLSVVKLIAESHGGSVRAESAGEGKGATFTVRMPARPRAADAPATGVADVSGRTLVGADVLVVDDDVEARSVIAAMLSRFGARINVASSVGEAMQKLAHDSYAVVVSDIAMPSEDGFRLMTRLRESEGPNRDTPVVAVTALTTPAGDRRFAATLQKPVDPDDLAATVAAAWHPASR
jgi:signal transduction histidine kinase